jgi:hypothetical protein
VGSIDIVALCLFICVLWLLIPVCNSELQLGMWNVCLSVYTAYRYRYSAVYIAW